MDLVTIDTNGDYPIVTFKGTRAISKTHETVPIVCNNNGYLLTISQWSTLRHAHQSTLICLRGCVPTTDPVQMSNCGACRKYRPLHIYYNTNYRVRSCRKCFRKAQEIPMCGTEDVLTLPTGLHIYKQLIKVYGLVTQGDVFCDLCMYDVSICRCRGALRQLFIDLHIYAWMAMRWMFVELGCEDVSMVIMRMMIGAN